MSAFHSTISRRDFMKGLGLAGAGFGATAAASPLFHDLDELTASVSDGVAEKWPWYIKEREYLDPTTEIDWDLAKRFNFDTYSNFEAHLTHEEVRRRQDATVALNLENMRQKKLLKTRRDQALKCAGWAHSGTFGDTFTGIDSSAFMASGEEHHEQNWVPDYKFIQAGAPVWEGTPEENARMMRAVCRFAGAAEVAFLDLNEKTKKFIYTGSTDGVTTAFTKELAGYCNYVFEDVDKPYVDISYSPFYFKKQVIPSKYKHAVVFIVREDQRLSRRAPSNIEGASTGKAYQQGELATLRLLTFIRALGYGGVGNGSLGPQLKVAWGALSGLGEQGRLHSLITPTVGPLIRYSATLLTDLPLPVTNPIDAGMHRFCETACTKCADACPGSAIPKDKEPTWDITSPDAAAGNPDHLQPERFNNPGHKRWPLNQFACANYWATSCTSCAVCSATCVFTRENFASVHETVKPLIAMTTAFNGFFFNMDKQFGFGVMPEEHWDDFWDNPLAIIGNNY
nr:reductive dehalogenase [uncultured bacterium]